ncbi:MAG: phosphatase PAP2 family protein [Patescibacteria group bacterium]
MTLDVAVFQWIHGFSGQLAALDAAGVFFAQYAIAALPFFIFFLPASKRKSTFLFCISSALVALFVNLIIGATFFRPRPAISLNVDPLISLLVNAKSFPSDHTAIAFSFAFSLLMQSRVVGITALTLAGLIGFSRIFVGVHYPFDILGGMLVGIASAALLWRTYRRSRRVRV